MARPLSPCSHCTLIGGSSTEGQLRKETNSEDRRSGSRREIADDADLFALASGKVDRKHSFKSRSKAPKSKSMSEQETRSSSTGSLPLTRLSKSDLNSARSKRIAKSMSKGSSSPRNVG